VRLFAAHHPYRTVSVRVFFALVLGATFVDCKCENTVRRAVEASKPQRVEIEEKSPETVEKEPNDAPEDATTLALGHELRAFNAVLDSPGDIDWFALTSSIAPGELVELRVVPEIPGLNLSLHLQAGSGTSPPLTYDVGGAGEAEVVSVLKIGTTPLRFAVRSAADGKGAYRIEFARRMNANVEAEPNDNPDIAIALTVPSEIQGLIDRPDDRDVFVLPASDVAQVIRIDYEPVHGVTQVLRIFDSARFDIPVAAMQFGGAQGERGGVPAWEKAANQPLFVVITTTGGFDRRSPYLLRTSLQTELEQNVEVEPNDRMARPLLVPGELHGTFYAAEDIDRFTLGVLVPEPQIAIADAGGIPSKSTAPTPVDLGMPDAGGDADESPFEFATKLRKWATMVLKVDALQEGDVIGITLNTALGERTWVLDASTRSVEVCEAEFHPGETEVSIRPVQLGAAERKTFDYRMHATIIEGADLEVEPNNTFAQADRIDTTARGFFGKDDVDVFGFQIDRSSLGMKKVMITVANAGVGATVELLDSADALIARADLGGKLEIELPAGVYFIRMHGAASCIPYEVRLAGQ
jgi:hypothetical protein